MTERPIEIDYVPRHLRRLFTGKLSEAQSGTIDNREANFLSRALAAYALHELTSCTVDVRRVASLTVVEMVVSTPYITHPLLMCFGWYSLIHQDGVGGTRPRESFEVQEWIRKLASRTLRGISGEPSLGEADADTNAGF